MELLAAEKELERLREKLNHTLDQLSIIRSRAREKETDLLGKLDGLRKEMRMERQRIEREKAIALRDAHKAIVDRDRVGHELQSQVQGMEAELNSLRAFRLCKEYNERDGLILIGCKWC